MAQNGSTARAWRRMVSRTHDFAKILERAGASQNLDELVTRGFIPMLQALVVRDTTSSVIDTENKPTAGKVINAGLPEQAMADKIARAAEALGIETHIVPITDQKIIDKFGQHAAVICRVGHTGKTGLMLAGHMDAVAAQAEKWATRNPFHLRISEDRVYGRGVADMKTADAAMLATLALMKQHEDELEKDFVMVLTPGEESWTGGSKAACAALNRLGIAPELVVVGEPDPGDRLGIGHPGFMAMDIAVVADEWNNRSKASIKAMADTITALDGFSMRLQTAPEFASEGFFPPFTALNYTLYSTHNFSGTNSVPAEAHLDVACADEGARARLQAAIQAVDVQLAAEENAEGKRSTAISVEEGAEGCLRVTIHGKAAHSWDPRLGVNAWKYWANLVERLSNDMALALSLPEEEYGVTPQFSVSYRCPESRLSIDVWKGVYEAMADHGLRIHAPQVTDDEPAMPISHNGDPVLGAARATIGRIIGKEASITPSTGWGEGAYYAALHNSPSVFYWFPHEEETSHRDNEFMTFTDMMKGLRGYLALAGERCGVALAREMGDSLPTVKAADFSATLERGRI